MGKGTGFWDQMNEGFDRGVPLGIQNAQWAEENKRANNRELREDQAATERTEAHRLNQKLGERQLEATDLELQEKQAKARQQNFKRAIIMARALDKEGDSRAAMKLITDAANNLVVNGQEFQVIHREDNPEADIWKKQDKSTNLLVLSPGYGLTPAKSVSEIIDIVAPLADPDKFFEYEREQKAKVEEANATEKPYWTKGKDGKPQLVVKKWTIGTKGREWAEVPYTGQEPMSATAVKKKEVEDAAGRKLSKEETGIVLGLTKPEGATEAEYHRAQAAKARSETIEGRGKTRWLKEMLELTGKQRDQFRKDLDLVLKPFVTKGKPTLDPDTGEMTEAGENGLKVAFKLIYKNTADPESLTAEEKRLLPHAQRAQQVYDQISAAVSAGYGGRPAPAPGKDQPAPDQAAIEAEAKRRGLVKDASGKWVKPKKSTRGVGGEF